MIEITIYERKAKTIILDEFYEPIKKHTGIELAEVLSKSRDKQIVTARQLLGYFLREKLNITYQQISDCLKRDRSSIQNGRKKLINERKLYADVAELINKIEGDLWQDQNLKD